MTGAGPPPRRRHRRGSDPGPRPVGASLDAVVARLGSPVASSLAAVFTRWEEIAGPGVSLHVHPVRLADGVLVVAADHPAWATQARAMSAELLARVGEVAGEVPGRLDVTVRRPETPRGEHPVG